MKAQAIKLLKAMNAGIFEKEEPMRLALLAAIARESIFLLGLPGIAKSLVARRLKAVFKDAASFEYLMNRFSTPEEIFGPVSITQLKNDKYERITEKYLPGADVVFLDEIWKAGPSIQNALLTVINEKVYRNGDTELQVPMKALIAASNELPAKGEGLEALWDRFILRYQVEGIRNPVNFNNMIVAVTDATITIPEAIQITAAQYQKLEAKINSVTVPEVIFIVIHAVRSLLQLAEPALYISDRRWKKVMRLLRTAAFINDRAAVDLSDCFLLLHCLWDTPEQRGKLREVVCTSITQYGYQDIYMELQSVQAELQRIEAHGHDAAQQVGYVEPVITQLGKQLQQRARELPVFQENLFLEPELFTLLQGHLDFLQGEVDKAALEAERIRELPDTQKPVPKKTTSAPAAPIVNPVIPDVPTLEALGARCAEALANAACTSQSDVRRLLFNPSKGLLHTGVHTLEFVDNGRNGANRLYKLRITDLAKNSIELPEGDRYIKLLHIKKN